VKQYGRDELVALLRQLDDRLHEPASLVVIGGAAAILAYGATGPTKDIDTWNDIPHAVVDAYRRLSAADGVDVPIGKAGVADLPYDAEDRLVEIDIGLSQLRLWVPERHDLALSKIVRAYQHDLDAVEQMHAVAPFDEKTIFDRFRNEMSHVIADPAKLRLNFAILVERLYGEDKANQVAEEMGVPAPHTRRTP
jgi:hypothetical protein